MEAVLQVHISFKDAAQVYRNKTVYTRHGNLMAFL